MARGSHWVDGEFLRGILQVDGEDGVDAGVGVFDLHVEVGQRSTVGNVFRDGDLVLGLVEPGWLVIDVPDGDGQFCGRACAGVQT